MQSVSTAFMDSLSGSVQPVVIVDVWRAGVLVARDLPVTGGQVQITAGQAIRSRVTVTVADPDGDLLPRSMSDPLAPAGSELHIRAGLRIGAIDELVSLGRFPIMSAESSESWSPYRRPDEPGVVLAVTRGGTVQLEAVDRMQIVKEDRFMATEQPSTGWVLNELDRLLRLSDVVPWRAPAGVGNEPIPPGTTYDDDRLAAVQKLAAVLDMDPIMDPEGICTLQRRGLGTPVWTIAGGDGGTRLAMTTRLSRDGLYNGVRFKGTGNDERTVIGTATLGEGPLAWGGPLKRIPLFAESPLISEQDSIDRAAQTRLATELKARVQEATVGCAWNPALEVGDTVNLQAPDSSLIPVRVIEATWPLVPGPMTLKVAGDPEQMAGAW